MDLSFQEKSAWGLLAGIVLVAAFYFPAAFRVVAETQHGVPLIVVSVIGVVAIIVFETIYHVAIAVRAGNTEPDERDSLIDTKAERNSGFVLGIGLFYLVGRIIFESIATPATGLSPLQIAVWILLILTVSEVAKLGWQIWYYRRGV